MSVNLDSSCCIVLVTCDSKETGLALAKTVVEKRLAACVNLIPQMTSVYIWQGELHEEGEALLVMKTVRGCVEVLQQTIIDLHPYELPEFIVLSIVSGYIPYLQWVTDSVSRQPSF